MTVARGNKKSDIYDDTIDSLHGGGRNSDTLPQPFGPAAANEPVGATI